MSQPPGRVVPPLEIRPLEFVGLEKLAVARLVSFRFVLTSTAFPQVAAGEDSAAEVCSS